MGAPDEAQLTTQGADDRRLDDHEDQPERGRADRRARPHLTDAPGGQRGEAEHAVAGEQAHGDHRDRQVARQHRQPGEARGQEGHDAGAEERDRDVQRAALTQPPQQQRPRGAGQRNRRAGGVGDEGDERARDRRQAAVAIELVGQVAGGVQREERIAGDPEIDQGPHERGGGGEHEQVDPPPPAPQPVGAGQDPRLRAQQPGHREHGHDRHAAARRAGLDGRRPQHEREEGDVDVGPRGVEQEGEARRDEGRAGQPRPQPEARLAHAEAAPGQGDQAQHADEDDQALAVGADEPHQRADREEQRVLGRRGVGLEVGLHAVHELAAPHEVEVGVVVGVGRHQQRGDQRQHRQRGDDEDLGAPHARRRLAHGGPQRHGRAGAEQRPRERVLEERGVHHRMGQQGHEGRRHGGALGHAPRPAEEARQRGGEQREVDEQPDHALLGRRPSPGSCARPTPRARATRARRGGSRARRSPSPGRRAARPRRASGRP